MANTEKKHVAIFVFPGGSHPFSVFNLVLKLAHQAPNLEFSFINTEQSNEPFLSEPHVPRNIRFYNIGDGVPKGHFFLQSASKNLKMGIDLAVAETKLKVSCIIRDAFVTPSLPVAQHLNVPWVAVWVPNSYSLSTHFHTDLIRQKCANDTTGHTPLDFIPGLSNMCVQDLSKDVIIKDGGDEEETLFSKALASMSTVLPQAKAVVVNGFEELDPPLLVQDMKSKLQSLLYICSQALSLSVPLPPSDTDGTGCLSWLDKQSPKSVAYVAFGTTVPPPHELVAVAEALEESGFPFLWSLKDHLKGVLPSGFLERTKGRGKIVAWAPQSQVLGHRSVGVHVTHCGCNSVFESISNGVPMVCRPLIGDNWMMGRIVESVWEIGVRVEGGVFSKNGLMKSLKLIMVQEEGKKIKENILKVKRTVLDASGPEGKATQDLKTLESSLW
ncbi:hypothetical protein RJT34_13483 [Clitoria ternatea]|uniref:Glycosyltransferase n=1 Tax=Clitoria ternatea TaxID=43366 RepID=A0AAN9JQQ6_CLITE